MVARLEAGPEGMAHSDPEAIASLGALGFDRAGSVTAMRVDYPGVAFHGKPCTIIREEYLEATAKVMQLVDVPGFGRFWLAKSELREDGNATERNAGAGSRADPGSPEDDGQTNLF